MIVFVICGEGKEVVEFIPLGRNYCLIIKNF